MDTARELTKRLADLLRNERQALADFIVALADFDRRRRYEELGHASLFAFLHRELGLSKGAAYYRMTAARLVQAFPEIVEPLRDGRLCMTSVVELSKAITPENRQEVLPRYFHLSKDEAKAVTAELRPAEIVPTRSVVTTVRAPALALRASTAEPKRDARVGTTEVHPANLDLPVAPAKPAARDVVEPLTKDLSRLHITVPPRVVEKIAAARDALSHRMPGEATRRCSRRPWTPSSRTRRSASAAPRTRSSSTIGKLERSAEAPPSRTSAFSVSPITSSRRARPSATSGWRGSRARGAPGRGGQNRAERTAAPDRRDRHPTGARNRGSRDPTPA
jgi:hypothetical protein